jgi:hypothetical protein
MPSDITDLPIGEAAHEVLDFEHSASLADRADIALGDSFTDPGLRETFARLERTEAIRSYRLHDVTLDASLMLLLRGRTRITETRYLVTEAEYAAALVKPLPAVPFDPAEHYVIGCNRAWHNYYHWLIQAVPAIDWSLRSANQRRLTLVLPPLRPWQEETLELLGCQDVPRLTLDISGVYHFPSAEFTDFLGGRMPLGVSRSAMVTFRRLSQCVPWTHCVAEEIYVARTDVRSRLAENEAELIALLERQGVRVIVPGTLPVSEQIAAFRAARLVIGPHGAGMTNIVFCRSGSFVYELLPRHYPHVSYNRAAQAAGLNYWADLCEPSAAGDRHDAPWRFDVDVVMARLDDLRARIAATPRVESAMDFLRRTQVALPD